MNRYLYTLLGTSMMILASTPSIDGTTQNPYIDKNLVTKIQKMVSTEVVSTGEVTRERKQSNIFGIRIEGDDIIIDTQKTRELLNGILGDVSSSLDNIEKRIDKQRSHSIDDVGIHIRKDQIVIDMNRTKNFVDELADSIDIIVDELNRTVEEMEKRLSQ